MPLIHLLAGAFWTGDVAGPGDPPDGPPTNVQRSTYGFPVKWRLTWANGDPLAHMRIHRDVPGGTFGNSILVGVENPGITEFNSQDETEGAEDNPEQVTGNFRYFLFHRRNGQDSTVVVRDTGTPI